MSPALQHRMAASPAESGPPRAGRQLRLPVLIQIPDLSAPPQPPVAEAKLPQVVPHVEPTFAPKPLVKPPLKDVLGGTARAARLRPWAVLSGAVAMALLLAMLLLRGGSEKEAEPDPIEWSDPPGKLAEDMAPPIRAEIPPSEKPASSALSMETPPAPQAEPDVMPWPREPAASNEAVQVPSESGPALGPAAIGQPPQTIYQARRPAAPAAQFEGTITNPDFRPPYERY